MNIKVCKFYFAIWILVFSSSIFANEYFNEKKYDKAFPIVKKEAKSGSKPSMYRLGYMYLNGLGVKKDATKAAKWFAKSASQYEYTLKEKPKSEIKSETILQKLSNQITPTTHQRKIEYTLKKMQTDTNETRELITSLEESNFYGLEPYRVNYMLPFSYAKRKYENGDLNTEVEFQLSFKKPLTYDLFGFNEYITLAYTQKVWWQMYSDSAPFRETNYLPEAYLLVPTSKSIDDSYGLKFLKFSFLHESNGRSGYESRSWNRLYASLDWQWNNLFLSTRVWYRLSESEKYAGYYDKSVKVGDAGYDANTDGDDNPDIHKYLGYGDIKLNYFHNKHEIGAMLRYKAISLHYSYPFINSKNTFWYLKFFNGYGESLIDYNHNVTKASFGFSFAREIF